MRWVGWESGVRREREPVVEVSNREGGDEGDGEGRRVRVVGKEAVWKVERGRRRWPVWDLGSIGFISMWVFWDWEGWRGGGMFEWMGRFVGEDDDIGGCCWGKKGKGEGGC